MTLTATSEILDKLGLMKFGRSGSFAFRNIALMEERADTMSLWVGSMILLHDRKKLRKKALETFIRLAEHCLQLNNMNGAITLIRGLSSPSIARLHKTWEVPHSPCNCSLFLSSPRIMIGRA